MSGERRCASTQHNNVIQDRCGAAGHWGASNTEIAERLVMSEKAMKSHVSNILSKLHVLNRNQAAIFAWREGVVRQS